MWTPDWPIATYACGHTSGAADGYALVDGGGGRGDLSLVEPEVPCALRSARDTTWNARSSGVMHSLLRSLRSCGALTVRQCGGIRQRVACGRVARPDAPTSQAFGGAECVSSGNEVEHSSAAPSATAGRSCNSGPPREKSTTYLATESQSGRSLRLSSRDCIRK